MHSLKFSKYVLGVFMILLFLVSQTACTATRLPPYEATYTTKLRGIKVKGTQKFETIGKDTYKLSWRAKALWMRLDEWSEFKVIDNQVIPISYHYTRKGLGSDRPIHVLFDWENMLVNASKADKKYQFALQPNVLDRLSYQVQMQIDLIESPEAIDFNYKVANYNGLKDYSFEFTQTETIVTPIGDSETRVYERNKSDKTIRLWISPSQNYLPVKIERKEDKKSNVVMIKSWDSETITDNRQNIAKFNNRFNGETTNNIEDGAVDTISDEF